MLLLLLVLCHAFSLEQMIIDEDPSECVPIWQAFHETVLCYLIESIFSFQLMLINSGWRLKSVLNLHCAQCSSVCYLKNCLRLSMFYWLILLGSCGLYNMLKIFMYITFMHLTLCLFIWMPELYNNPFL